MEIIANVAGDEVSERKTIRIILGFFGRRKVNVDFVLSIV